MNGKKLSVNNEQLWVGGDEGVSHLCAYRKSKICKEQGEIERSRRSCPDRLQGRIDGLLTFDSNVERRWSPLLWFDKQKVCRFL